MSGTERFGLARKIVANMTSTGWREIPHVCLTYEADMTGLLQRLEERNADTSDGERITLNTAMLKVVAEGLKACPGMNGHIRYRRGLVMGRVTTFEHIDISMPVRFPDGRMMPVTLRNMEDRSLAEIQEAVRDVMRRAWNTDLNEAMYQVSIQDTREELKRLHLLRGMGRLLGFALENGWASLRKGEDRRAYEAIPETDRLTGRDLKQGTVTVSNLGALYRDWPGSCTLLEVVPPQLCAIALGAVQDRVLPGPGGTVRVGKVLPMTVAFDHRALDAGDIVPFFRRLDGLLADPGQTD